uniref:Dystroglycan-type cadherin-like domain-containing protein n=2 Tax=Candidatus Kentrum eta TaxID=2126337 RepID=A0A450UNX8_9GAMM|nr:MAG: hypothetical protein BECKH772B_GA0070898_100571 [Candidatus Kentron sp. H]
MTLNGADTVANYQAALRSVTYRNGSEDPTEGERAIGFTVTDGEDSGTATRIVNVTAENDAPELTPTDSVLEYREGNEWVAIDTGLALSDVDDEYMTGATVEITDGFQSAEDVLTVTLEDDGEIALISNADGLLVLEGRASKEAYESVLRSVTYQNTLEEVTTGERLVTFSVTDEDGALSDPATRIIDVIIMNNVSVVDSGGGETVTDADPAVGDVGVSIPTVTVLTPSTSSSGWGLNTPISITSPDRDYSGFTRGGAGDYRVMVSDSRIMSSARDMATRGAESAPSAPVCYGFGGDSLAVNRSIENIPVTIGGELRFQVPYDIFVHSNPEAEIQLQARQIDGSPLPDWLEFDPETGFFTGTVPETSAETVIALEIIARDISSGCEVAIPLGFCVVDDETQACRPESMEEWEEESGWDDDISHTNREFDFQDATLPAPIDQHVCRSTFSTQLSVVGRAGFVARQAAFIAMMDSHNV